MGAAAVAGRPGGRLRGRRHGRVHRRRRAAGLQRRRLLVHGDEHAAAGRASGHRSGHRARSGRMAVPRRRRRGAAAHAGRGDARRPRRRGAALCRGPRARLPAVDRQVGGARLPAGRRRARRYRRRSGRRDHAVLRSDDRQGDRARRRRASRRSTGWPTRSKARVVVGPRSNLGFLAALCRAPAFRAGEFDTGFIDAHLAELGAAPQPLDLGAVARGARRC